MVIVTAINRIFPLTPGKTSELDKIHGKSSWEKGLIKKGQKED